MRMFERVLKLFRPNKKIIRPAEDDPEELTEQELHGRDAADLEKRFRLSYS